MNLRRPDPGSQPELTDGVIVLRPWRDEDIDPALLDDGWSTLNFLVEHDGTSVGQVVVRPTGGGIGELTWTLDADHRGHGYATRAVSMLIDYAFEHLDMARIEAYVNPANERSLRVATRSGMRREGVLRSRETLDGERHDAVVFARLVDDPPISDPASFRMLLNSFLPRKRAISQMLIRDDADRVLLCQLTYKWDWDLPGGVVEVGESPQVAATREVEEELGLDIKAGALLLTDWLPPWGGWDDALCLVFDGGTQDASIVSAIVKQDREIRSAQFCTPEQMDELCADFTTRRIESALSNLASRPSGPSYTESGRHL